MWDSALSLKQSLHPSPQFRAEIDHRLGEPVDEHAQQQDAHGGEHGLAVHLPDDFLVALHEAHNQPEVLGVRAAENVQQVANPERDDAQQHVRQHVVDDGQGEGDGLDSEQGHGKKRQHHDRREDVACRREKQADERVQKIPVHHVLDGPDQSVERVGFPLQALGILSCSLHWMACRVQR